MSRQLTVLHTGDSVVPPAVTDTRHHGKYQAQDKYIPNLAEHPLHMSSHLPGQGSQLQIFRRQIFKAVLRYRYTDFFPLNF